jgi:hypothetical protein
MKMLFPILAIAALVPAGMVLADDDDCRAPVGRWQPREAVMALAETRGWTVTEFEIDDGCYEIEASDSEGKRFEAKLDPATLEIVEMEGRDRKGRGSSPAPAGTVAPPANGLFGDGAPPAAVTK